MSKGTLQELRDELAAIQDPLDWGGTVAVWASKARPFIRSVYGDYLPDFEDAVKTPQWLVLPRFASSRGNNFASASAREKASNSRLAAQAQQRILAFLDGLLALDVEKTAHAGHDGKTEETPVGAAEIDWVLTILRRFSLAARALQNRPRAEKAAAAYAIEDEYDVQDLLFAVLKPLCDDLEREDPVPKTAGDSGRVDLSSRMLGTIIEIKFAKNPTRAAAISRECRERVVTYSRWPDLRHLVFFVYDPDGLMSDPDNFVSGLTSPFCTYGGKSFSVTAVVSPWQVGLVPGAHAVHIAAGNLVTLPEGVEAVRDPDAREPEDELALTLGQAAYSNDYRAVMIPASIANRADQPNSVERVQLTIGGVEYEPANPPPNLVAEGMQWFDPDGVRIDAWGSIRGVWYFGRGIAGGTTIELPEKTIAELTVVPVRGVAMRATIDIVPLSELQQSP